MGGSSSLLGSPSSRSTYEDDRTAWPHCWCLQEEGRLIFKTHVRYTYTKNEESQRRYHMRVLFCFRLTIGAYLDRLKKKILLPTLFFFFIKLKAKIEPSFLAPPSPF